MSTGSLRSRLMLVMLLLILPLSSAAQDTLPTETATATLTETPTATLTETPTVTLTETALPNATETATLTAEPTLEPTPSLTASPSLTLADFPTASPEWTATPSLTPSATIAVPDAEAILPPDASLTLLFSDSFDTGDLSRWTLGAGWSLIASAGGLALQSLNSDEPITSARVIPGEVSAQVRFLFETGTVRLTLRQSEVGNYTAMLEANGTVSLFRSGQLVTSTTVSPNQPAQWRTLGLSAAGNTLSVSVDGVNVLTALDVSPLPPGTMALGSSGAGTLFVDDISASVFTVAVVDELVALAASPTPMFTPTASGPVPYQPPPERDGPAAPAVNLTAFDVTELRNQISYANNNCAAGQSYIIDLLGPSPYTLMNVVETFYGNNGLPVVRCDITIRGNGKTIQRSSATQFRIIAVDVLRKLTLDNVTIAGGSASDTGGSGVFNFKGELILTNTTVINNTLNVASTFTMLGAGVYSYQGKTTISGGTISNTNSD